MTRQMVYVVNPAERGVHLVDQDNTTETFCGADTGGWRFKDDTPTGICATCTACKKVNEKGDDQ